MNVKKAWENLALAGNLQLAFRAPAICSVDDVTFPADCNGVSLVQLCLYIVAPMVLDRPIGPFKARLQ